jgi:hypothetical protein
VGLDWLGQAGRSRRGIRRRVFGGKGEGGVTLTHAHTDTHTHTRLCYFAVRMSMCRIFEAWAQMNNEKNCKWCQRFPRELSDSQR